MGSKAGTTGTPSVALSDDVIAELDAWRADMQGRRHNPARLAMLRQALILDSAPEPSYDAITQRLASCLDVPIVMISMLDDTRDWFKACVGMPQSESPAQTAFCSAFFDTADSLIVVADTTQDRRFANHPLVLNPPKIRFYGAARLELRGQTVGTLCAYDIKPRNLSIDQLDQLRYLAASVMELLGNRGVHL